MLVVCGTTGTMILLSLMLGASAAVRGQIDWQAHPAMHIPWEFYDPGLVDEQPALTHKHTFTQTMYAPYMAASGVRILLAAAMAAERARNPEQARALILEQFEYVEAFVAENPERYALARTPQQARQILETTDKMVVIHSIEGGRLLLTQPDDAQFWADQGVALVTLIHLQDDEFGGAAINPDFIGKLINRAGVKKRRRDQDRGLTGRGEEAMVELDAAGILVDLTHMSPQAVGESLVLMEAHDIPPVVTHGKLSSIHDSERAFTDAQVSHIYRQGGVFNMVLSGLSLQAMDNRVPEPADYCPGTLDGFQWHYDALQSILDANLESITGVADRSLLTEDQKTALATGWASDWNGWVNHSQPRHGPGACVQTLPEDPLEIDTLGLAHPGLLPQHWQRLEEAGVSLDPMLRSAERFLQLWERALDDPQR